jgi:16S rRNA G966 N2-methylase RsmD
VKVAPSIEEGCGTLTIEAVARGVADPVAQLDSDHAAVEIDRRRVERHEE